MYMDQLVSLNSLSVAAVFRVRETREKMLEMRATLPRGISAPNEFFTTKI